MTRASLNHVGIAVRTIEEALPFWKTLLPGAEIEIEDVPEMKVRVAKLRVANTSVELIEPREGEEAIAKFLAKKGPGIHHICMEVADVDAATRELAAKGYQPVYPAAKAGSGGMRVNFLKPGDSGGVLIELNSKGGS